MLFSFSYRAGFRQTIRQRWPAQLTKSLPITRSGTIAIGRMVKKIPTQGQTLRRSVDMANCMYVRVCSLYARWKCFRKGNYQYVFYIHLLSVFMYTCVFPSIGRRGGKSLINQVIQLPTMWPMNMANPHLITAQPVTGSHQRFKLYHAVIQKGSGDSQRLTVTKQKVHFDLCDVVVAASRVGHSVPHWHGGAGLLTA